MVNQLRYIKLQRFFPLIILCFLVIATLLTLTLTKKQQELRSKAAQADNGQLTFANLTPTTVAPGNTFDISVNMNGGGQTVVGADILVQFDSTKLALQSITRNTLSTNPYKTYVPVTTTNNFDSARVIACANGTSACPTGTGTTGTVEFGIVSFDLGTNTLTSPNPTNSNVLPVATFRFQVKSGAVSGSSTLNFVNGGTNITTDSNIVVNPQTGDPEDILQPAPYTNSSATVMIGTTNASPQPSATPNATPHPSASPSPSASSSPSTCNACYNFDSSSDGRISVIDIQYVAGLWGKNSNSSNYQSRYDIYCGTGTPNTSPDGQINVLDIQMIAGRWNQNSCTPN
ncbi:MAG: cohesin domain-containing protein [Patescibacteria group bacterium]